MWLRTPESISDVIWEGRMEAAQEQTVRGEERRISNEARQLPVVSVGRPEVWNLPDVYPPEKMPDALRIKLDEADFYVVRLSCSFRTRQDKCVIKWARFAVRLSPDEMGHKPIAYDLHPLMVFHEVKHNVSVILSPTLKFQEIEANLGESGFGLQYQELQPIISAAGAGQSDPSWDYEEAKGMRVQGTKWMHLLMKLPKEQNTARASLDVTADVEMKGAILALLAFRRREQMDDQLIVELVRK